ncbi:hypothetical protein RHMOL_Rhmol13G0128300 [Rhododendron molle]|uniref:Uncharacterized protein n=1 Tax=Rhododendron molle TaxID=49168 RepID=A0ACC0L623_RHOML|nr:hypothetical protein RHMOL_Rhmol13G0128300 [Rhododendron molle]
MCVCVCAHLFEPVRTMKATTTAMTMTIRTTKMTTMKKAKDRSVLSGSYFLCFLFTQIFFVMQDFESERQWKLAPWSQQGHVGPGHKGRKESEAIEFLRCAREVKYDAVIVDSSDPVGMLVVLYFFLFSFPFYFFPLSHFTYVSFQALSLCCTYFLLVVNS